MGELVSIKIKKTSHDKFLQIKLLEGTTIHDQVESLLKNAKNRKL